MKTLTITANTAEELEIKIKTFERKKKKILGDFRSLFDDKKIVIFYEEKRRCTQGRRRN